MADDTGTPAGQVPADAPEPTTQVPVTGNAAVAAAIRGDVTQPDPTQQVPAPSDDDAPDQASDDADFDRERAMRTISRLREIEKQSRAGERQLKEQAKRLADYEQREREAADAQLSETERLKKQHADLEQQLAQERQAHTDRANRYEVQLAAGRLGIVDPDAAEKLLDWTRLEYDGDGRPADLESALRQLVKDRPYLAGQPTQPAQPRPTVANPATRTSNAPGQRVYTAGDLDDYEFYVKHRDDILAAMKEPGRPRIQ